MRVTWITGAGFAVLLAADCGGVDRPTRSTAWRDAGGEPADAGFWVSVGDGGHPDAQPVTPLPQPPAPPDAGAPPVVACGDGAVDAGSVDAALPDAIATDADGAETGTEGGGAADGGGLCPLPAPSCLGSSWVVYYSGGTCQDGVCAFVQHVVSCPPGGCANGRCGAPPPVSE